jgi:hypothetical protein
VYFAGGGWPAAALDGAVQTSSIRVFFTLEQSLVLEDYDRDVQILEVLLDASLTLHMP